MRYSTPYSCVLWTGTFIVQTNSASGLDKLLTESIEWTKANGGYINDKIEIKPIVGDFHGIFTNGPMKKGEIATSIPWKLIIGPDKGERRGFCEGVEAAMKALKTPPEQQSPYIKYLWSRSTNFHPRFWSTEGRQLLQEMKGDYLPPGNFTDPLYSDLTDNYDCEPSESGEILELALMLMMTRTEGDSMDHLVPFNDHINHRNGKGYTADPVFNIGDSYQIIARRDLEAGEQITNSYNQCEWCSHYRNPPSLNHFFVTPHLFDNYGFIEQMPQRWIVPEYRLLLDVVKSDEDGTLLVNFAVPPSPLGVSFLESEITRLEGFVKRLNVAKSNIPEIEYNGIEEYRKAILTAYKLAYEQSKKEIISDEVWYRGRDEWYWEDESYDDVLARERVKWTKVKMDNKPNASMEDCIAEGGNEEQCKATSQSRDEL